MATEVTESGTRDDVIAYLELLNPEAPETDVHVFVDAYLAYRKASEDVYSNGAIENPFLPVMLKMGPTLRSIKLETGLLMGSKGFFPVDVRGDAALNGIRIPAKTAEAAQEHFDELQGWSP